MLVCNTSLKQALQCAWFYIKNKICLQKNFKNTVKYSDSNFLSTIRIFFVTNACNSQQITANHMTNIAIKNANKTLKMIPNHAGTSGNESDSCYLFLNQWF